MKSRLSVNKGPRARRRGPGDLDEGPSFSASSLISNPTPFDGGLLGAPFVFAKWGHGGLQCFLPADSSLIPQRWCKALAQKETSCFISLLTQQTQFSDSVFRREPLCRKTRRGRRTCWLVFLFLDRGKLYYENENTKYVNKSCCV